MRAHPRHLVLGAVVAGLLAAPLGPLAVAVALGGLVLLAGRGVLVAAVVLGLCAGCLIADLRMAALAETALRVHPQRVVETRATLLEAPGTRVSGTRAAMAELAEGRGAGERVLLRAPPYARWEGAPRIGAEVAVRGRIHPLGDREAHAGRRGAQAVLQADAARPTGRVRGGLAGGLDRVRERAEAAVSRGLPPELGALARGMVLGQDDALSDELQEDFRASGLAHLVAASGTNVLLLCALVLGLSSLVGLPLRARLALCIALVAAYVPLAGAGPSIQRAGVMGVAALVAALAGRPSSRWYAVLLAAALTLAWNPRSAGDVGWQLSFAAVLAMLALARPLRERLVARRVPPALAEALALTLAATLGTAPLLALHFERFSLVSLPANLLAVPVVAPVMWIGTLAAVVGQGSATLAAPLAALAVWPLGFLAQVGETAAGLPLAEVQLGLPGPVGLALAYALLAALVLSSVVRRTALAVALVAAAVVLPDALTGAQPPAGLRISFLDVGQGDATLVQYGRHAILVDTGPRGAPLLEELRAAGARRLDALVVTHPAADHDAGAAAVLRELPVDLLVDGGALGGPLDVPGPLATPGLRAAAGAARVERVRRLPARAGTVVRAGPLEARVLWPPPSEDPVLVDDPNDRAVVLHVRAGTFDALLTADAESDVTLQLDLPEVELLKVAHHGSDDAGLPLLLDRLDPDVAVIPVGRNRYGHPTPATLAALREVPTVRRTDRHGTVRITTDPAGRLLVEEARP
ncbi:MAG: ComEC/Rec2 family competence protein [Solirubrobacteraceae bacterium MAG38_C4-C5]|nr:ComEC/Rec2 family competence protein [Candidatus Siliceabacter maunaloa]